MIYRLEKNGISVVDLSDKDRYPPNPVMTFEQAFANFREFIHHLLSLFYHHNYFSSSFGSHRQTKF